MFVLNRSIQSYVFLWRGMNSINPKPETALRNMWNVPHLMLNVPQAIPGSSRFSGNVHVYKGEFQMTSDKSHHCPFSNGRITMHWMSKSKVAGALKSTGKTSEQPRRFQEVCPKMALDFCPGDFYGFGVQKFGPLPADKTLAFTTNKTY